MEIIENMKFYGKIIYESIPKLRGHTDYYDHHYKVQDFIGREREKKAQKNKIINESRRFFFLPKYN